MNNKNKRKQTWNSSSLQKKAKAVPDNVSDQIDLWRKETERLNLVVSGTLVTCLESDRVREVFREAIQPMGDRVVWDDGRRRFFVQDGGASVKSILEEVKRKLGL